MPILHLGVTDVPYTHAATPNRKHNQKPAQASSTGDVAEILENKYHVMEHFAQLHGQDIGDALAEAMQGSLENLMMGAPIPSNPLAGAESKIEDLFREMLTRKELDSLGFPGIPTKAALQGRSSRFRGKKGSPRPSFIDTGLLQTSFRSWID